MQSWAAEELKYAQINDSRLNKRLIKMVEDFTAKPEASVPQACETWAATKAAYNFWGNSKVTPDTILSSHQQSTLQRIQAYKTILAIQDTTDIDFTSHPKTEGLGPLDHPSLRGLKVHSCLTVSPDGVPQGLIYQEIWTRDPETIGKKHKRHKLETKDKESQRWLNALSSSQEAIPESIEVITVADREADIYDLFALPRRQNSHLLIRAAQNRLVDHELKYLWAAIRKSPVLGEVTVELGRKGDQAPRKATLLVRCARLSIQPPSNRKGRSSLPHIPVSVILAEEERPPKGVKPVSWLLLATWIVETFEEAVKCVSYYSYRWLIERYHFVLKSGCGVEKLQLEKAEGIEKALATYCIVAWRLLWLTYEARVHPDSPCDKVLESYEWESLYYTIHRVTKPPKTPPSLHDAVIWIAMLGGFLGRKGDGEPGVKTIWRGMRRLDDISSTWRLLHDLDPDYLTEKLKKVA